MRDEPDFVAPGSLAIKAGTEELETACDFAISESSEAAQSSPHNNHEVAALIAGCEGRRSVALATGLDELEDNVAGNFECFGNGTTLGDEAGKLFAGREIDTVRKQFHVNLKGGWHEGGKETATVKTKGLAPIHPGDALRELLVECGMTVNGLAMALRVPANRIGAIVKGQRGITGDTALRLGRYFGKSAQIVDEVAGEV